MATAHVHGTTAPRGNRKAPAKTVPTADSGRRTFMDRLRGFFKADEADIVAIIGRIASVLSVIMYVSYITQIMNNLGGHPGTPWQPLAAFFNCVMWTAYGLLKPKKDWPIVVANVPGIFLAAITFVTSLL